MSKRLMLRCALLAVTVAMAAAANAQQYGFWDPGFAAAVVRTPYEDDRTGTSKRPLTLGNCSWKESITGCPRGPVSFRKSNAWDQNRRNCRIAGTCGRPAYWIFQNNNEPAFNACNPGPPNASLPRAKPGRGIMGFTATRNSLRGESFHRAHLVLNLDYTNPCDGGYGIPFMSLVVDRDRGNLGRTPGALNPSSQAIPSKVEFVARLWDLRVPRCDLEVCETTDGFDEAGKGTVDFSLWAVAEWGGTDRMLFIDLVHANREYAGGRAGNLYEWNWPIREDFLAPGADLAFLEAEDLPELCGGYQLPPLTRDRDVAYSVDLQRVFRCASDLGLFRARMPASADIPVRTIGWKTEGFGRSGGIWASVHGMRMRP